MIKDLVVRVGPLTMARVMFSTLIARTQRNIRIARQISSMVQSVETLNDRFEVSTTPRVLPLGEPMVYRPVGKDNVAIKSVVAVEKTDRTVLISINLDAYLLDRFSNTSSGPLVSSVDAHFSSKIRINLRETVDAEMTGPRNVARRRLSS